MARAKDLKTEEQAIELRRRAYVKRSLSQAFALQKAKDDRIISELPAGWWMKVDAEKAWGVGPSETRKRIELLWSAGRIKRRKAWGHFYAWKVVEP